MIVIFIFIQAMMRGNILMYSSLKNKTIIITGGASGIGLAAAKRFYAEKCNVIVLDKQAVSTKQFSHHTGNKIIFYEVDVSDRENMNRVYNDINKTFDSIDVVVANAGISIRHSFLNIKYEDWDKVINTNLHGVFNTVQLAVTRMIKRKSGVILIIGSTNGITGHPHYADYNASKAAISLLGKTLAKELAPKIRVNIICPGYVMTPMQKLEYSQKMLNKVNKSIPLKRHGTANEIANLMAFLASDQAAYITGQNIIIDGGETA